MANPCWSGLENLARSGDWERVLAIAARRADQLPLNPTEAMIAARAARAVADPRAERHFLEIAVGATDDELQRLAEVQLAELVGAEEPGRAVTLALPAFGRENPWQVRASATEVSLSAVNVGIEPAQRATLEGSLRKLSRSLRRKLELTLAESDPQNGRHRLERLLAASTRDLVALEAAGALAAFDEPTSKEQWRIAQTLYRHAMYDSAAPIFEQLVEVRDGSIPRDEAAFLRGRCAFRRDRWRESIEWYQKALGWERSVEKKAEIEVHIARCYELEGNLDKAVDAAVRAVRLKTSDDRRLFLARLRLRRGEPDLAEQGLSRLRSRTDRSRGEVMLAVDALKRGDVIAARNRLEKVRRAPWAIPAAVLSAELAAKNGDADAALDLLDRVKGPVDDFWVNQARLVMGGLPQAQIETWRLQREQDVRDADGGSLWRALGRWAVLEPDPAELRLLRGMVDAAFASFGSATEPAFHRASRPDCGPSGWSGRLLTGTLPAGLGVTRSSLRGQHHKCWRMVSLGDLRGSRTVPGGRQAAMCRRVSFQGIFAVPCIPCRSRFWSAKRRRKVKWIGRCWPAWRVRNRGGNRERCQRLERVDWCS